MSQLSNKIDLAEQLESHKAVSISHHAFSEGTPTKRRETWRPAFSSKTNEDEDFDGLSPISDEQKQQDVAGDSFINTYLKADHGEKSFVGISPIKDQPASYSDLQIVYTLA